MSASDVRTTYTVPGEDVTVRVGDQDEVPVEGIDVGRHQRITSVFADQLFTIGRLLSMESMIYHCVSRA